MDDQQCFEAGVLAHRSGNLADAERIYAELLARRGEFVPVLVNLASVRFALGRRADAVGLLRRAVELDPRHVNARVQLGLACARSGDHVGADAAYLAALANDPDHLAALNNRAMTLEALGRHTEAIAHYFRALAIDPERPEVHQNVGVVLAKIGRLTEARRHLVRAAELAPHAPGARVNLSQVLVRMGSAVEGLDLLASALASPHATAAWHSNFLLDLHYAEEPSPEQVFEQHLLWARRWHSATHPTRPRAVVPRTRRLRVGYVTPDLRNHAVAYFFEPLLEHHDRSRFELFAYASIECEDAVSARLRTRFDRWLNVFGLSDEALAARIRDDGIDVLVDLAGHTAGNRLGVFARAPAPVQLTYLGYPDTTGLAAIDARVTDLRCDPPGSEPFHTERLLHVATGMHVYRPPSGAPEPAPPPLAARGHLTFGSFNNTAKMSERTIARWAAALTVVPTARMLLKFPTLADRETSERFRALFERHGIASERVELRGGTPSFAEHLAAHAEVDVMLDTFPYHGTTTTCEALWMGVPVVTLVGDRHAARVGLSLLDQVGLASFALEGEAEWLARVAELDTPEGRGELATLRATLRERMRASSLCDGAAKTRAIEALYLVALKDARARQPKRARRG